MEAFYFENSTKVWFVKGCVSQNLPLLLKKYGKTVILTYSGGSVKRNGVYDEVIAILQDAGKTVVEFSEIMSNLTYAKVQKDEKLVQKNHIDLILAEGGGSISVCCKIISAQVKLNEDLWKMENTKHVLLTLK